MTLSLRWAPAKVIRLEPTVTGENTSVTLALLPVEILDKDKKVVSNLKVAKMVQSGVLSGSGASVTLNPEKDSDRFYIRIPGGASFGASSVKIATVENPNGTYNDNETDVDFEVQRADLITKSMLLVSDDVDDNHRVDGIEDDVKNDRTHKIQLGGKLQIRSLKLGATEYECDIKTPAPFEKTVKVHAYILKKGILFYTQVIDPAVVIKDMERMQERFAQAQIKIAFDVTIVASNPAGVELNEISPNGLDRPNDRSLQAYIPEESKNLFKGLPPTQDKIVIYYVNRMHLEGPVRYTDQPGISTPPRGISVADSASGNSNRVIISKARRNPFTAAHELMHILLDAAHDDYAEFGKPIMLWKAPTSDINTINATKRISEAQSTILKTKTKYPQ